MPAAQDRSERRRAGRRTGDRHRVATLSGGAADQMDRTAQLCRAVNRRQPPALPTRIMSAADGVLARDSWSHRSMRSISTAYWRRPGTGEWADDRSAGRHRADRLFPHRAGTHDVIFAEGTPAETYVECDNRGIFHNGAEFARLYPGEANAGWQFCAPRTVPGSDEITTIRRRLFARATQFGFATTADPDPRLIVDGETVPAARSATSIGSRSRQRAARCGSSQRRPGAILLPP